MNQLAWLGEVPKRWRVVKLRQILRPFSEKNHPELPLLSVVREKGVIVRNVADKEENHNYVPEDLSGYKRVKRGQFAMNKMKAWQGSYGVSNYDGIVSPAYFVFDIDYDIDYDFFNAAIRSKAYVNYFGQASDGIRVGQWDLSMQRMKEIPFLVPPRDEQEQIVRFLDWKVSAINRLINLRRKEIKFLEDVREIIICNSVYGINTNSKPIINEIEHINIPSHWKRMRIKNLFDMRDERNHKALQDVNLLSLYAKLGVIQNKDIEYSMGNHARTAEGYKKVYKNDIVVNIILCWMGAVGISLYDGVTSPAYDVYIPRQNVCSQYYHYLFRTKIFSDECYKAGKGIMAMRWRVYSPQFRNICVPYPPIIEQIEIVNYLDRKCKIIENHIQLIHGQIENLHDLKARLISDVVTGKIDVRGVEVPEYETVEEETGADLDEEEISEEID